MTSAVPPTEPPDSRETIRRASSLLAEPGAVHELRILGVPGAGVASGYFDDLDAMAAAADKYDGRAGGVYITANPVLPALLARAKNRVQERAGKTTGDDQITSRRWLPIDVDWERPAGISTTEEEHEAAIDRAHEIARYLVADLDWPGVAIADSGNGAHVLARIDLPNDRESTELVSRCLAALAFQFGDDSLVIDESVSNPARIWKLYGTLACKGDSTAERPHRRAQLLYVPEPLEIVPREKLEALAALAPRPEAKATGPRINGSGQPFDVDGFLSRNGIAVLRSGPWTDGTKWVLEQCPFAEHSTPGKAYVVQLALGAVAAGCQSGKCEWSWHDLRARFEPRTDEHRARGNGAGGSGGYEESYGSHTRGAGPEEGAEQAEPRTLCRLAFTGAKFAALADRPALPPIVPGIPPAGHLTLLIAPKGFGKSTLLDIVAAATATGARPWEGGPLLGPGRVLILSPDESPEVRARRMRRLALFAPKVEGWSLERAAERLFVLGSDREAEPALLDAMRLDDAGLALLEATLAEAQAAGDPFVGVLLDAWIDFLPFDMSENDNGAVARIAGRLEHLAVRFGCYVYVLHHEGKPAPGATEGRDPRFAGRGASALNAKARCVFSLEMVAGATHLRRVRTVSNLAPVERESLFEVADPQGPTDRDEILYFRPSTDAKVYPIAKFLKVGESISTSELARRLAGIEDGDAPGDMKRLATRLRESWRRDGLVEVAAGGTGKPTTLVRVS